MLDNQKIVCALTYLCAPTSIYMKSYYDKVETGLSIGSWGNFVQELKNIYRQHIKSQKKSEGLSCSSLLYYHYAGPFGYSLE